MHPETPVLLACLVGLVGVVGLLAAMVAANGVRTERKILEKGISRFRKAIPGIDGGALDITNWFNTAGLPEDSHFGDCLKSVWSGRRASRLPTLAELHNLSVRRERRRHPARFASGIIGLLVISGIAGTLVSIHPILDKFNFISNPDGTAGEASKRAESASKMIQQLGSAFYPSLAALFFTVMVAAYRGSHYVRIAGDLAWELDRFVIDELFPTFKLPTMGEELRLVGNKLSVLTESMRTREAEFGLFVATLSGLTEHLTKAAPSWIEAGNAVSKAAKGLTVETRVMLNGFATHLGADSPVVRSLASIEPLARDVKEVASQYRQAGQTLASASTAITGIVDRTANHLDQAVSLIIARIEQGFAAGRKEIIESSRAAAGETAAVVAKVGESTEGLLNASAAISETVDRTIRQLDGTVASIPRSIEKGFAAGSNELVEFSRMAAAETAAAIAKFGESTAGLNAASAAISKTVDRTIHDLDKAISAIPRMIGQSSADARNELIEAGRAAGNEVVTAIADAGSAEVEKLKQAAASIREDAIRSSQNTGFTVPLADRAPVSPRRDDASAPPAGETTMERQLRRSQEAARRFEEETAAGEDAEPVYEETDSRPPPPPIQPPHPPEPEAKPGFFGRLFGGFRRKK